MHMLRALRNLTVNIMAAFIRDREARHKFRNKYKIRSKFRKLRDDNRKLLLDNKKLLKENILIRQDILQIKLQFDTYSKRLWDIERERSHIFRSIPIDNSPPIGPNSEAFLAIACVAKNEGPYLKEWIEYHKIIGVQRFYFYDNESDDNTLDILKPYINEGTVVYHVLKNHSITQRLPQIEAYNDVIFKYRDRAKWMAFIDIDEFIVLIENCSIYDLLSDYEQYPALAINWLNFDSNGHLTKPLSHGGLVTANYTRVRKDRNNPVDRTVKSIVNPKLVVNYISPHYALYYDNTSAVTENFEIISGKMTKFHSSIRIRLNHYKTKSHEEYQRKLTRNISGIVYPGLKYFSSFQDLKYLL